MAAILIGASACSRASMSDWRSVFVALAATCCGDPERPFEIPLIPDDITPWEVSWSKLARALCQALGLESRFRTLPPPNTVQFGAWSADAVPAILTDRQSV